MISPLELRHIIESGFAPTKCVCTINDDNLLTVNLYHPNKGHPAISVRNLNAAELTTSRAISNLIAQLKDELASQERDALVEKRRRE
jgi:hypothetical protein